MIAFIAVELDEQLKGRVFRHVQQYVKPCCRKGRWVAQQNYHITLKYLGETAEQHIGMLDEMLKEISKGMPHFILRTGNFGVFGERDNGSTRVLWLGTEGDAGRLKELKHNIESRAALLGYQRDNRFSPHITLARDVVFVDGLQPIEELAPLDIPVNAVSLMESRVEKGGRVYLPLSVYRFI